jgi:hypothetical protein
MRTTHILRGASGKMHKIGVDAILNEAGHPIMSSSDVVLIVGKLKNGVFTPLDITVCSVPIKNYFLGWAELDPATRATHFGIIRVQWSKDLPAVAQDLRDAYLRDSSA